MRAKEMPNVFRPGIRIILIKVTFDPTLLTFVTLGMSSFAAKKKSWAFTSFGSLQANPLTKTA